MRALLYAAMMLVLLYLTPVWAATGYDDVPADHWAYGSLNFLTEQGILEGYPEGFFAGDRTLTRFEFGQATARLLDTLGDTTNSEEQIRIMTDALRAEFSDQLALIEKKVALLDERLANAESQVEDLDAQADEQSAQLATLADRVAQHKPNPGWNGYVLDRWDFTEQGNSKRFTNRLSFALGYNKQVDDNLLAGFRFKTNTGNAPNSSTWVLGQNGKTAQIFLDRAYIKYSPDWLGTYAAPAGETCLPKLDVYAGIYPNITRDQYYMVLDTDVNLQGLGLVYHFNSDFQVLSTATVGFEKNGNDYFDDDTYMFACEARHNNLGLQGLDAWLGCFGFTHPSQLPSGYFKDNGRTALDLDQDGATDSADRFSTNFHTVKGGLQYTVDCVFDKPLALYAEYMVNTRSNADTRIAEYNQQTGSSLVYEAADDSGYLLGTQYGKTPEAKGDWAAYLRYKEIGANAIIDGLSDAGVGGANVNSVEANVSWMFEDNSQLGVTFLLNKMNNAFGLAIPDDRKDQQIMFVDWLFKF